MAIRVEIETTIKRPIEDVFERLVDISAYAQWLPQAGLFIKSSQCSEGPVTQGTPYIDETTVGTLRGEVIEFQRPARVVFRQTLRWFGLAVMESRPGYALEPVAEGTRLHHTAEARLYGIFKLLHPRVVRLARAERQRTVDALKRSLETPPRELHA